MSRLPLQENCKVGWVEWKMGTGSEPKFDDKPAREVRRLGACPHFPRYCEGRRPKKGTGTVGHVHCRFSNAPTTEPVPIFGLPPTLQFSWLPLLGLCWIDWDCWST